MPETSRLYPVFDIAISVADFADNLLGERKKAGDIIVARRQKNFIGAKEKKRYLWLRVEGLELSEMHNLSKVLDEDALTNFPRHDKRRYCIPLERLEALRPEIDMDLVKNVDLDYQPDLISDDIKHEALSRGPIMQISGLVYDKHKRRYI